MQENKKTKLVVVIFLLAVVAVSGVIMLSVYKVQLTATGTVTPVVGK